MHFSSPSGQRLSWWWPWNRGAVGRLSSGYITVSTFRNISRKVTPNPLTGLRKSSTGDLLDTGRLDRARGQGVQLAPVVVRAVQRRDRVALDVRQPVVALGSGRIGLQPGAPALRGVVPERDEADDQDEDEAGDRVPDRRVGVAADGADRRDEQDPHDGQRDKDLPAERHELVVPGAGQRAAQPDVAEEQDEDLD